MKSLFLVCALVVAGCGSSSSGSPDLATTGGGGGNDLAMSSSSGDMAMASNHPGDGGNGVICCNDPRNAGNSLGVGKYCDTSQQCMGLQAAICATIGDPNEHFCTMLCTMGSTACGTGASCQCQNNQCGCVPDVCVTPPPGC